MMSVAVLLLVAGTLRAAEMLGKEAEVGTIEPGKRADLVHGVLALGVCERHNDPYHARSNAGHTRCA